MGWDERCGIYTDEKLKSLRGGNNNRLWIHAVSVGEVQAASPIVENSHRSGWGGAIVISTVTATGAASAKKSFGDRAAHIYAPWDAPDIVWRACEAVRPSAYLTVETEIWPNILAELKKRSVPTFLVNGRISDRTLARVNSSAIARILLRDTYSLFDRIFARTAEDAERMSGMGIKESIIHVTGDCKVDAVINRRALSAQNTEGLRKRLMFDPSAPCFVAGSTHAGEDEIILEAFSRLTSGDDALRGAKLVIVPRHPERSESVKVLADKSGRAVLLSELDSGKLQEPPDIVVTDIIGVLFDLYGLAVSAFIGGSLVPSGGQNILEPASWGIPILHGPHMDDFAEPTARLDEDSCSYEVHNASDIASLWRRAAGGDLPDAVEGGAAYFAENSGASLKIWSYIERYL